jgi:hypothetical protein
VGLAVALAASLLAVAYLMGRESLRAEPAVTAAPARPAPPPMLPPATDVMAPVLPPATEVGEVPPPNGAPDHAVERPPAPAPGSIPEPPAAAALQVDAAAAGRVAAYFARLGKISGSGLNDPSQEAAQRLLGAALQGDTTALDGLVADTERAEREVQAIVVPPECAEYHRELLGSLVDGRALLGDLRATLAGEGSDRLVQMSARAAALQRRAEDLHSRERDLRGRYGVPST